MFFWRNDYEKNRIFDMSQSKWDVRPRLGYTEIKSSKIRFDLQSNYEFIMILPNIFFLSLKTIIFHQLFFLASYAIMIWNYKGYYILIGIRTLSSFKTVFFYTTEPRRLVVQSRKARTHNKPNTSWEFPFDVEEQLCLKKWAGAQQQH